MQQGFGTTKDGLFVEEPSVVRFNSYASSSKWKDLNTTNTNMVHAYDGKKESDWILTVGKTSAGQPFLYAFNKIPRPIKQDRVHYKIQRNKTGIDFPAAKVYPVSKKGSLWVAKKKAVA